MCWPTFYQYYKWDYPTVVNDSFPNEHLFSINYFNPWYVDIANYLATARTPPYFSPKKHQILVENSFNFSWILGYMFYIGQDKFIERCVWENENHTILCACHDDTCGGHFVEKRTAYKILETRYCCPTFHKDAKKHMRNYDRWQCMGHPKKSNEMSL